LHGCSTLYQPHYQRIFGEVVRSNFQLRRQSGIKGYFGTAPGSRDSVQNRFFFGTYLGSLYVSSSVVGNGQYEQDLLEQSLPGALLLLVLFS